MRIKGSISDTSCSERQPYNITCELKGIFDMIWPVISPAIASKHIVAFNFLAKLLRSSKKETSLELRIY